MASLLNKTAIPCKNAYSANKGQTYFNKTKYQYVADFDMFFKQPVEDIMTIIPSNTGINEDSNMDN